MAKTRRSPALFELIERDRFSGPASARGFLGRLGCILGLAGPPRLTGGSSGQVSGGVAGAGESLSESPKSVGSIPQPQPERDGVVPGRGPRQITLRLSYTSAVIAIAGLLTVVGAAFLAGRHTTRSLAPRFATISTEQLRQLPPTPGVTDLQKTPVVLPTPETDSPTPTPSNEVPPAHVVADRQRRAGLNYVIIQSYPEAERKLAEEAIRVLAENGIDATLELDLPGWARKGWYAVVGTDGFDRISNSPRYDAYIRKINQISSKYAKPGSFKAFSPTAYKWGRSP